MEECGPWDVSRRVAVAVSGGSHSLCLALLAQGWGQPLALIVDHGLRPEAAREATWTAAVLSAHGIANRILTLRSLAAGPGVSARARRARYGAMEEACREAGLVDLLLGHHAGDQAETVLMRQRQGSGRAGLAGMPALRATALVRLVRPLLDQPAERLRATLHAVGQHEWVDDPSNQDMTYSRVRARDELARGTAAPDRTPSSVRMMDEATAAAELAFAAMILPEGWAVLRPGPLSPTALGMLLRAIGGSAYPAPRMALASLAATMRPATLAGVRIMPAGRYGPGWLLVREAAAMAAPVEIEDGAIWDGRFRVCGSLAGWTLGALGGDAAQLRHLSPWPSAALQTLPALRHINDLSVVPHLSYGQVRLGDARAPERISVRRAGPPVCGSGFTGVD